MDSKEKVYDEKIAPLMKQIIEICKENNLPMFADFQFGDTDFCTTCISPQVEGEHFIMKMYNALSQCKMDENAVNIDKFIMWIMKFPNKSSAYLHLLGKKAH